MDSYDSALSKLLDELDKGRISGETEGWLPFDDVFDELFSKFGMSPSSAPPSGS